MQLFSRNKALSVLSLGALAALGACGDDVTVPVAPAAPVVISITPPSSSLNVGESVSFAVQISGGSPAPTLASCTSSNTAVATAAVNAGACRVTAVAAGNATVTAAASTGQSAAASVTVSAPAPAITALSVSPSAAQLAVGQSVTLVPTVQPAGRTVAYTYATSAASIATVANGVVTAVAPGVATITVTAAGSGAGFSNATIAQAVTITVSERTPGLSTLNVQPSTVALALGGTQQLTASAAGPRASAATITYGTSAPAIATVSATGVITAVSAGTAVVTVTAQSAESGAFAASSITGLVAVTVSPNAQVAITGITSAQSNNPIDISNVTDQIQVNLGIQPNGQTVSEANVWVCDPSETVAACAARTNGVPAARQSFTASGTQAANIQLFINTSEFAAPNFTTGADANTLYKNGLRTIVATLTTSPAAASTIASNSISQLNFNNPDGWTISWTAPANRANSSANITWFGGPSTPDPMVPGSQSGTGSFVVVPVVYTPNRTVVQASFTVAGCAGSTSSANSALTDTERPFGATYGTNARSTTQATLNFNCSNSETDINGLAPAVSGGVDNNNTTYGGVTLTPTAGRSIFRDFVNTSTTTTNGTVNGYYQSLSYRPNNLYLPHDYAAPTINFFNVRGGGAQGADSGWVSAAYQFDQRDGTSANNPVRYSVSETSVGLLATRNAAFDICPRPESGFSATAPTNCTAPVATGGLSSTVASLGLTESQTNFTNLAWFAQARETDRLGNRATSVVSSWANASAGTSGTQTAANTIVGTTVSGASFGVDLTAPTIRYSSTSDTTQAIVTAFNLAPEAIDDRSGLRSWNHFLARANQTDNTGICVVPTASSTNVPGSAFISNPTCSWSTASTAFGATLTDGFRPLTIGAINIAATNGYYTYRARVFDRALNEAALPQRLMLVDPTAPQITGMGVPSLATAAGLNLFTPNFAEDVEVWRSNLRLTFGGSATAFPGAEPSVLLYPAQAQGIRFDDVITANGNVQLSTPFQTGVRFYTDIEFVDAGGNIDNAFVANTALRPSEAAARLYGVGGGLSAIQPTGILSANVEADNTQRIAQKLGITATASTWALGGTIAEFGAPADGLKAKFTGVSCGVSTAECQQNPPFARVDFYERNTVSGAWTLAGSAEGTAPNGSSVFLADNGTFRVWTYRLPSGSVVTDSAGATTTIGTPSGRRFIAIGTFGAPRGTPARFGRVLASHPSVTYGNPFAITAIGYAGGAITINNASAAQAVNVTPTAAGTANIVYTCTLSANIASFVTVTATATGCSVSPNGALASGNTINGTLSITANGSGTNLTSNTVTLAAPVSIIRTQP